MRMRRLRILAPAACCALALVAPTSAGAARTATDPAPHVLWEAYPLNPAVAGDTHGARPSTSAARRPTPAAAQQRDSSAAPKRSAALKIVVVAAAVVVGVVIGLIPALLLGMVLGVAPRPRLVRRRRRAPRALARPAAERPSATHARVTFEPRPVEQAVMPLRPRVPPPVKASLPAPVREMPVAARKRHRDLYDAAYADQLLRTDTLRRKITARMTIAASSPGDDAPPDTD